jgi:hypothetical protein
MRRKKYERFWVSEEFPPILAIRKVVLFPAYAAFELAYIGTRRDHCVNSKELPLRMQPVCGYVGVFLVLSVNHRGVEVFDGLVNSLEYVTWLQPSSSLSQSISIPHPQCNVIRNANACI